MKIIFILPLIAFLLLSCTYNSQENNLKKNENITSDEVENIQNIEVKDYLVLKEQKYFFEKKLIKNTTYLSLTEPININNEEDIRLLMEYLEYWKKSNNIIIDSFYLNISSSIYTEKVFNDLIDNFEGKSINLSIKLTKTSDFIPLSKNNIDKIYTHKPNTSFIILSSFSEFATTDMVKELQELKLLNIREFKDEYFDNWKSENRLFIWGIKNMEWIKN